MLIIPRRALFKAFLLKVQRKGFKICTMQSRAMTMKEVVVRLIIDQPGWLLYPEPILPDVQSLTHTPSPRRSTARFLTEGDSS